MEDRKSAEEMERALVAYAETFSDVFFYGTPAQREALEIARRRGRQDIVAKIEANAPKPKPPSA